MIENSQSQEYLYHEAAMEEVFVDKLNQATGSIAGDSSARQLPHKPWNQDQPLATPKAPNSSPQGINSDENPVLWHLDAQKSDFQRS